MLFRSIFYFEMVIDFLQVDFYKHSNISIYSILFDGTLLVGLLILLFMVE